MNWWVQLAAFMMLFISIPVLLVFSMFGVTLFWYEGRTWTGLSIWAASLAVTIACVGLTA